MGGIKSKYERIFAQMLIYFVPAFVIISIIVSIFYFIEKSSWLKEIDQNLQIHAEREKIEIKGYFRNVLYDLAFLNERTQLFDLFNESDEELTQKLEKEYAIFIENHPLYQQIRFIDTNGDEIVRVDTIKNQTIICPKENLQNKKDRYYFQESIILEKEQVYISPLDLNVEHGEIEIPFNPMIRLAAPVFDRNGTKRGVVVLNYKSNTFLSKLENHLESGLKTHIQTQLLNNDGFWLHNLNNDLCWGFMLDDRRDFQMSKMNPELWEILNSSDNGQFSNNDGRYSYETIYPINISLENKILNERQLKLPKQQSDYYWKLIAFLPDQYISTYWQNKAITAWIIFLLLTITSFFISFILAKNNLQKKAAESKFKTLYEESMEPIFLLDGINIVSGNPASIKIFGFENEEELKKTNPVELSPEYQPDGQKSSIQAQKILELTHENGSYYFEWKHKIKNGKEFDAMVLLNTIEIDGNKLVQATIRDITELKTAQEKAQEALEMKAKFVSTASHELRTPLTAIKESINVVFSEMTGQINDDQKEFLGIAKRNVDRLARLINDVLDFQKMTAGKMDFVMKANNLNEIIRQVADTMESLMQEKGLTLEMSLADNIKDFNFDSDKITQVLTNLMNNAIKFTDKGSIKISTSIQDRFVITSVEDTGFGIKPEDIARLFKEFEQLETPDDDRKIGGTGLGLAICKKIIEKHNGTIWATSGYRKGTIFSFQLPLENELCQKKS